MRPIVRQWTDAEIQKLKDLMAKGASAARCCGALNRSSSSIKRMARQLGAEVAGVRELKADRRKRIEEAERSLRPGQQRNNGTFA